MRLGFTARMWWMVAGLAFLWPCLQSSGFYPLSLAYSVESANPVEVAHFHLAYSLLLAVLFALVVAVRKKCETLLVRCRVLPVIAGVAGVVGQMLVAMSSVGANAHEAVLYAGIVCVALFVSVFVTLWGTHFARFGAAKTVLGVAVSFVLSQAVLVACYLVDAPITPLLCFCALSTALCAVRCVLYGADEPVPDCRVSFADLKELPGGILAIALLLIYFCIVFVRLQISSFSGDAASSSKLLASVLCLVIFAVVVWLLASKPMAANGFIVMFVALVCGYLVGLSAIALFSDSGMFSRRVLIADEHCLEVFVWMILVHTASRKNLSGALVFGLYGVVVVAIPWMISFDGRYLTSMGSLVASSEWLPLSITVALCVTALCVIALLAFHVLRISRDTARQSAPVRNGEAIRQALSAVNLTPREMDVVSYACCGYSAKRTAELLYVSEPTVKSALSSVYRKLGIHSKQELIDFVDGSMDGQDMLDRRR